MSESFYESELDRAERDRNGETLFDDVDKEHVESQYKYKDLKKKGGQKGSRRTPTKLSVRSRARAIIRECGNDITAAEIIEAIENEGCEVVQASRDFISRLVANPDG